MKKTLLIALATIGLGIGSAQAGVSFGVSFGSPRVHCAPPVVYSPAPVYHRSAPVYYRPAPVYAPACPAPVVVSRPYCPPRYVHQPNVIYFGGRHDGYRGRDGYRGSHGYRGDWHGSRGSSRSHGSISYRW